jgi:hypothetical protein
MSYIHSIDFNEAEHKYTYTGNDPKYIGKPFVSTTTFIGWFKNEFDGEYWATYKAVKDVYDSIGTFSKIKKAAGGWEGVVDYWRANSHKAPRANQITVEVRKQWYLNDWASKGRIANVKGSKIHKDLEDDVHSAQQFVADNGKVYGVKKIDRFYEKGITVGDDSYPECIIYNLDFSLSGMVDRVERSGIYLDITDYKTNIKVDKESFRDQTMKVLGIPDSKFNHYQIQMSIYGWMLEQYGYKVRTLTLEHLITESRESERVVDSKTYAMEYRPDWVEKMLEYRFNRKAIAA